MAKERVILDTNILIRFFTGDSPEMAEKVYRLMERADHGEVTVVVFPVIVAETFYTLKSFYKMPTREIAQKLSALVESRKIEALERDRLVNALSRCADKNAHFADAYLAAASVELSVPVVTFDADFDKFQDVKHFAPQ